MRIYPKTLWVFYYKTSRNGERFVIGTQECKQPERTKMRKQQMEYWKHPDVVGTGYTNDLNDPELFWPQSQLSISLVGGLKFNPATT